MLFVTVFYTCGTNKISNHLNTSYVVCYLGMGRNRQTINHRFKYILCCLLPLTDVEEIIDLSEFKYILCCLLPNFKKAFVESFERFKYILCCLLPSKGEDGISPWLLFKYILCCLLPKIELKGYASYNGFKYILCCLLPYYVPCPWIGIILFKYILCCLLPCVKGNVGFTTFLHLNTSYVVCYLCPWCRNWRKQQYLNTSYVVCYLSGDYSNLGRITLFKYILCCLLPITEKNKCKLIIKFKYILCCLLPEQRINNEEEIT